MQSFSNWAFWESSKVMEEDEKRVAVAAADLGYCPPPPHASPALSFAWGRVWLPSDQLLLVIFRLLCNPFMVPFQIQSKIKSQSHLLVWPWTWKLCYTFIMKKQNAKGRCDHVKRWEKSTMVLNRDSSPSGWVAGRGTCVTFWERGIFSCLKGANAFGSWETWMFIDLQCTGNFSTGQKFLHFKSQ